MQKKISIVVPVYNEENSIQNFYCAIKCVIDSIHSYKWNIVFINDGSIDDSYRQLLDLAALDPVVRVVDLSKNFGKEIALTAGVEFCKESDAVICIDADLQHPPEVIPKLIADWEGGSEMVVTIRESTESKSVFRNFGSRLFYWIQGRISNVQMVPNSTDFRLFDRKVVIQFLRATERNRMFRGLMDWMGFRRSYVIFKASARVGGVESYSLKNLWKLAINGITSFSLWPLRFAGYLGVCISFSSLSLLIWMVSDRFIFQKMQFSSIAILVVFNTLLFGVVLMSIGLVALYIGTIHTEVVNRPLYVVRELTNF